MLKMHQDTMACPNCDGDGDYIDSREGVGYRGTRVHFAFVVTCPQCAGTGVGEEGLR